MNRIQKVLIVALASSLVAATHSTGAAEASTNKSASDRIAALIGDPVLAKGKGVEVKRSQLDAEMLKIQQFAAAQKQTIPPDRLAMIERDKLNDLIGFQLLMAKANETDKAIGKELFEKALKRIKKDNKLTDEEFEEKLSTQLKLEGVTRAAWDKQRIDQNVVAVVLQRELKINVTEADAKKYYDENASRFEQPEQVRASHVLIATRDLDTNTEYSEEQMKAKKKTAEDIRKRAVAGEDFAKLAKEFSDDPGSKDSGGEYTFPRGRMVPDFEAAAFSLATNQVSDIVTTPYGYHIIKLSEKIPAKVIAFAEVADDLREALKTEKLKEALRETEYLDKLQKDAGVEIVDERMKKVDEMIKESIKEAAKAEKEAAKSEAKPAEKK
jgi:parvulin-like peptidyl-prolyl isomerase